MKKKKTEKKSYNNQCKSTKLDNIIVFENFMYELIDGFITHMEELSENTGNVPGKLTREFLESTKK